MTATAAAAITPPQMIFGCKYHESGCVEIKVAGLNWFRPAMCALAPESSYAILADACAIPQFRRHSHQQLIRNFCLHAPA